MFDKARQLLELRKKQAELQKELSQEIIEVEAGEGAVKIEMDGEQKLQKITISPELLRTQDAARVESLLEEAIKKAISESQKVAAEVGKKFFADLGLPGL